jgi:hypothetical protein
MKATRKLITAGIAVIMTVAVAPALAGCSALEGIIEQATGGQVNVSVGSLPDGWPTDVEVVDGDILGGGTAETDEGKPVWNATIKGSATSRDDAAALLTGAGFEAVELPAGADVEFAQAFKNDTYGVLVATTGSEGDVLVNYTVTEGDPVSG